MSAAPDPQVFDPSEFGSVGGVSACPACVAAPSAERLAQLSQPHHARLIFSLPAVHCAACISTVENAVQALPGVQSARVNLTLRGQQTTGGDVEVDGSNFITRTTSNVTAVRSKPPL